MDFKPFKIGKYLLLERLATGGMAEVYRAKASGAGGFEKQLAIKRILPSYSQNEEFQRMFEYEARLSSMLTHANIVQVYDFVKSGETYLLALEYVDGKNLRQFVNKVRKTGISLPIEFGVYVINEVCKGLEYAHKKKDDISGRPLNIIHRDMSPQNIMLSYDGAVKIVDFGIAKAKDRVDETRSGVIKGKFGYMSPEQANGQPVDHRTDIFSTAIILWELLTGKRLFAAENDMATLKLIQECVIPSPSRLNPRVTPELEKIVLKGLTKDLSLRYQSAGSFHRSLQEFLNKNYSSFTQREAADILQRAFGEEIENEKRRFEQIYRQSIPFSQGQQKKKEEEGFDDLEDALDGSITKSEADEKSAITSVDELDDNSLEDAAIKGVSGGSDPDSIDNTQVEALSLDEESSLPTIGEEEKKDKDKGTDSNTAEGLMSNSENTGDRTLIKEDRMPVLNRDSESGIQLNDKDRRREGGSSSRRPSGRRPQNELVLGGDTDSGASRRRERSISAISDMNRSGSDSDISLVSMKRAPDGLAIENTAPKKRYYPERDDYRGPKRSRAILSLLFVCATLAGFAYLYRLYLDQRVPYLIDMFSSRQPGGDPKLNGNGPDTGSLIPNETMRGDCTLQIDSDPAGASVLVNGVVRGTTSTTISVPCNQVFELGFRLDNYEVATKTVTAKQRMGKLYETLKPIPMGKLELTIDRNAEIYIDNALVGDVKAGERFERLLRANKKYHLYFVNKVFNISAEKDVLIEPDRVQREEIRLVEPMNNTRPK